MNTNPFAAPVAAEVRQDVESEASIIQRAKQHLSTCNWGLGECASQWTQLHARGRTDADFGAMVGMSGDQVGQRRRVWERFGSSDTYPNLSWSHYYAAVTWEDADDCLEWAYENSASVAEMKAWRQSQYGISDTYPNLPENGQSGEDSRDPFGEREEGTGTDAGGEEGGTETEGKDSQEHSTRPPRNGTDKPGASSPPKDPFVIQRSKAVKTLEACSRAIGDLAELKPFPQKENAVKAIHKLIETVKAVK